jgi:imidazoleglycerol-phosphate dehydratase
MDKRVSEITRKTTETQIELKLNLDGSGKSNIKTSIAFLDHMLTLFSHHGTFDFELLAKGDIEVDFHHTVEDIGIVLGEAFRKALGNSKGITRFASGLIPMDEALCQMAIDVSNRPYLAFINNFPVAKTGEFDLELVQEFFQAFVNNARITLHINILAGQNMHHMVESCFKAFGILLKQAVTIDEKKNIPSTKGIL